MRKYLISYFMPAVILAAGMLFSSCHWAKEKTKATVNKAGEVVAKAGSEFTDGVSKGIEKTFENKVEVAQQLKEQGLAIGKITIHGTDSSTDNVLSTYLIFNKDLERDILVKVFTADGKEYGRCKARIKGSKDDARYMDFIFDARTNIDGRGKLVFE
jgi:hypothetical protein